MWKKKRHSVIFWLLRGPFRLFLRIKYHYKAKKMKLPKRPYLIISNHLTTLDPIMLAVSFNFPIYFLTSADLFSSKYGGLIKWLVNPIPKRKSVKEMGPIKDMVRICKEGGTVAVFPEGNRSYDGSQCFIDDAIAKLAKLMKTDIILYNIHGGYGIDPRWAIKGRKGKSYGAIRKIISKEDVAKMSVEELFEEIKTNINVPVVPTTVEFKSKNNALGLERVLYLCPKCGKTQTLYTESDYVKCRECGLEVKYNQNLEFETNDETFQFKYVSEWGKYQIDFVKSYQDKGQSIFTDKVQLYDVPFKKRPQLLMNGEVIMYSDRFEFQVEEEKMEFKFDDIFSVTCVGKNKLNFYIEDKTYQVKGDVTLNTLKYMQMYYHFKNLKEGKEDDYFGM